MVEVLRLASQGQIAPTAPPARKDRHREKPPDFSAWTDEELRALVEMHERRKPPKADRHPGSQRKAHESLKDAPLDGPEADQTTT
jgi:hypothetical protein